MIKIKLPFKKLNALPSLSNP